MKYSPTHPPTGHFPGQPQGADESCHPRQAEQCGRDQWNALSGGIGFHAYITCKIGIHNILLYRYNLFLLFFRLVRFFPDLELFPQHTRHVR
jgi:hypothetical protein